MLTECAPSLCQAHARPQPACARPVFVANPRGRDCEPVLERRLREPGDSAKLARTPMKRRWEDGDPGRKILLRKKG